MANRKINSLFVKAGSKSVIAASIQNGSGPSIFTKAPKKAG